MPDINYWLAQKYALLQQQADAGTLNAQSNAGASAAAAAVDNTRARLMPKESAANITQTMAQAGLAGAQSKLAGAQAGLVGEQAKYFGPTALADIGYRKAQTSNLDVDTRIRRYEGLDTQPGVATGNLSSVFGPNWLQRQSVFR